MDNNKNIKKMSIEDIYNELIDIDKNTKNYKVLKKRLVSLKKKKIKKKRIKKELKKHDYLYNNCIKLDNKLIKIKLN